MAGDTKEFGARLERLMLQKGLSQADLAKKLKVSHVQISRYVSGSDFPRYMKLKMLIRILGCTPTELLGDSLAGTEPTGLPVTLEKLKTIDTEQLVAELKRRGFPEKAIEFVRSLEGIDLEPWQVDAT